MQEMTAALAVAREGYVSQQDVEKAILDVACSMHSERSQRRRFRIDSRPSRPQAVAGRGDGTHIDQAFQNNRCRTLRQNSPRW